MWSVRYRLKGVLRQTGAELIAGRCRDDSGANGPTERWLRSVNVLFEEIYGLRDISLMDMSGRIVKQWKGSSDNSIQIDNLLPGMYSLRVVDRETGKQSVDKILINGR